MTTIEELRALSKETLRARCEELKIKYTLLEMKGSLMLKIANYYSPREEVIIKPKHICKFEDCDKRASYGAVESKIAEFCKTHAKSNYVDVKHKRCVEPGCIKQPIYNLPGNKVATHCAIHKLDGMVDIKHKRCNEPGCTKHPSYGISGHSATHCTTHKLDGMIDVVSKRCNEPGCTKHPSYGLIGSKLATHCAAHKLDGMVDIKNKRCVEPNCTKQPSYGLIGSKLATHCATHKLDDMVDVISKRCIEPNCKSRPSYGLIGSKLATHCATHKLDDMVDVINKRCNEPGCTKHPSYGLAGGTTTHCATHKLVGMINIKHKRCIEPGCDVHPHFGLPGYSTSHCVTHKSANMVSNPTKYKDVEFNVCEYCSTKIYPTDKFCSGCKIYQENGVTVKRKNKELAIRTLLDDNKIEYTHDLIVKDGCSKKRPDFVIRTSWGTIILEVDEHQHNRTTYTCECEITRMKQLYFDVGCANMLFIRYNPDTYKPLAGKPVIKSARETFLIKYLEEVIRNKFDGLGVVYLYYDGFVNTSVEIEPIDPYA